MFQWMRSRLMMVAAVLMVVLALTGCGGAKETPAAAAAPAPAAQTCPECPKVDKAAILKEATVAYFNTLPPSSNMIDAAELKKKLDAKDATIFVLDIRKPEDYAKSSLEGTTNIAMSTVGANIDKLPKDKQIVVICYSGQTAGQTVAALKIGGYNAIALKGGFPSLEPAGITIKK